MRSVYEIEESVKEQVEKERTKRGEDQRRRGPKKERTNEGEDQRREVVIDGSS
jgi:hypothetical protein